MSHYRCTRFYIILDFDVQIPPDDATVKKMIREGLDDLLHARRSKARNIRIVGKKVLAYD